MDIIFEEEFEEILKEKLEAFDLDSSLVKTEFVSHSDLLPSLPSVDFDKHSKFRVRLRVVGHEGKIPDIDEWFRSHEFKYLIVLENFPEWEDSSESIKVSTMDSGEETIDSIAIKIHDIFKSLPGQ